MPEHIFTYLTDRQTDRQTESIVKGHIRDKIPFIPDFITINRRMSSMFMFSIRAEITRKYYERGLEHLISRDEPEIRFVPMMVSFKEWINFISPIGK